MPGQIGSKEHGCSSNFIGVCILTVRILSSKYSQSLFTGIVFAKPLFFDATHHRSIYSARADGVDADVFFSDFQRDTLGKTACSMLGGTIRSHAGSSYELALARDVYYCAFTLLSHLRNGVFHAVHDSEYINIIYFEKIVSGKFGNRLVVSVVTGIIYQYIKCAESFDRSLDRSLYLIFSAYVYDKTSNMIIGNIEFSNKCIELGLCTGCESDLGTFGRKCLSQRFTDSTCRTCDQNDLVFQT